MFGVDVTKPSRIFSVFAVVVFVSHWLGASQALACACCTDPGYRNVHVVPFDGSKRAEIKRVRFANSAELFVTDGGLETVKGIKTPSERYKIKAKWEKSRVVFDLRDAQGRSGTLSLGIPLSSRF